MPTDLEQRILESNAEEAYALPGKADVAPPPQAGPPEPPPQSVPNQINDDETRTLPGLAGQYAGLMRLTQGSQSRLVAPGADQGQNDPQLQRARQINDYYAGQGKYPAPLTPAEQGMGVPPGQEDPWTLSRVRETEKSQDAIQQNQSLSPEQKQVAMGELGKQLDNIDPQKQYRKDTYRPQTAVMKAMAEFMTERPDGSTVIFTPGKGLSVHESPKAKLQQQVLDHQAKLEQQKADGEQKRQLEHERLDRQLEHDKTTSIHTLHNDRVKHWATLDPKERGAEPKIEDSIAEFDKIHSSIGQQMTLKKAGISELPGLPWHTETTTEVGKRTVHSSEIHEGPRYNIRQAAEKAAKSRDHVALQALTIMDRIRSKPAITQAEHDQYMKLWQGVSGYLPMAEESSKGATPAEKPSTIQAPGV